MAFESTHAAMASEAALGAAHAHAAMIPTPRAISAGCGMSMRFDAEDDAAAGMLAPGVRRCPRPLGAVSRDVENGIRASREAVKPAKQNEEGCALPRFLYMAVVTSASNKKRRSQERRSNAGGDACESNTPETFCAPRNGFEGREVHQEPIHLHMSVVSTVKPSKHSTQFSRGPTRKIMRS